MKYSAKVSWFFLILRRALQLKNILSLVQSGAKQSTSKHLSSTEYNFCVQKTIFAK